MKDQVVLITGASGGIGSVMAAQFADADAKVILHYNSQKEKADSLCNNLNNNMSFAIEVVESGQSLQQPQWQRTCCYWW